MAQLALDEPGDVPAVSATGEEEERSQ